MPSYRWMGVGLALAFLPAAAQVMTFEGIVEPVPDGCNQFASHSVSNPCTGLGVFVIGDLGAHVCKNVVVEGVDVGVECTILNLLSVTPVAAACPPEVRQLRGHHFNYSWFDWFRVPCGDRYDFIRGNLNALVETGGTVGLGTVSCVVNDTPYGSSFSTPDWDVPAPGQGFFYLVRAYGPSIGSTTYGWSSSGAPRVASSGDCSSLP